MLFIDVAMLEPTDIAATAIAEPTMARISAYSAAETPAEHCSIRMNVRID